MNAMDLMTGLNNVRDKFVVSAGEFRQGERQVRALPKRKLWLIAAVIALAPVSYTHLTLPTTSRV